MVRVIRETVTVEQGGVVQIRSDVLSPGSRVQVIVIPEASSANSPQQSIVSFQGSAKGVFSSPDQAEAFVRAERDEWESREAGRVFSAFSAPALRPLR